MFNGSLFDHFFNFLGNEMKINLSIYVDEENIHLWLMDNPSKTREDFHNELNNVIYLGGDCIHGIAQRMMEIDIDYFIEKKKPIDKLFLSKWSDGGNFVEWKTFKIITLNDCNEANGYSEQNRLMLDHISIGDRLDLSDGISQFHQIERLR